MRNLTLEDFEICDGDNQRTLTAEDTQLFDDQPETDRQTCN